MNPFQFSDSALATAKLVMVGVVAIIGALVLFYFGNVFYKANKLDRIETQDKQTAKALKSMGKAAEKQKKQEAAHFAKTEVFAGRLTKELSNEKAKFDASARAEYHRVLNDALRGAE
ncbi:MAG: hypothetical protein ACRDAM_15815 [Casimicrobium sp.]